MDELIISVAPCPGEKQTERFPGDLNLVREVVQAVESGAAIAHLHARDPALRQTTDASWLARDVEAIRSHTDVIIEASTGGAPEHTLVERCASFTVPGVELGTLNLGSINMYDGIYQNSPSDIERYAQELHGRAIKPINIVFDLSHFGALERLRTRFPVQLPQVFSFVFDVPNTLSFSRRFLDAFLHEVPPESPWFLTRYHACGAPSFREALERGGHVRVGFEDGPFLRDGRRARSNAEIVTEVVQAAADVGRQVASPEQARAILGLQPPSGLGSSRRGG